MSVNFMYNEIKRQLLLREIRHLESELNYIVNCDPDVSDTDNTVKAYQKLISEKRMEYEDLLRG